MECSVILMYGLQLLLIVALQLTDAQFGFGKSDRVLLEDVKTLTLHKGRMTTGRRSSPVQQMACIGGSAGCSTFQPQVVQCYNRGSDGYDVQWECKSDMDNAYRFGKVEVICEGYDYPEDPYILAGSCGLEYTLDLTKEGMNQPNQHHHDYYGSSGGGQYGGNHYGGGQNHYGGNSHGQSRIGQWIMTGICLLIVYGIYKSCSVSHHTGETVRKVSRMLTREPDDLEAQLMGADTTVVTLWVPSFTHPDDDTHRRGGSTWGGGGGPGSPPPPGFRPEYQPDSCSGTAGSTAGAGAAGAGAGGLGGGNFWTGAAAGGLMGYLFGNQFRGGYNRGYGGYNRGYGGGWGSGWGGSGYSRPRSYGSGFSGFGGGGFSSGSRSTGTRTASGFGGTRRR